MTRREFLKLATLTPLTVFTPSASNNWPFANNAPSQVPSNSGSPNIILLLFDSLTARNMSLYGYSRATTPNLARFAENALVYHAHHAPANFTTPSTASLFTGAYPWTHRAYQAGGLIQPQPLINRNLFHQMDSSYQRIAFAQNVLADLLLIQCAQDLDQHIEPGSFSLFNHTFYNRLLSKDTLAGYRGAEDFIFTEVKPSGSLYLYLLDRLTVLLRQSYYTAKYGVRYPRGFPTLDPYTVSFMLEAVIDGTIELLKDATAPFFSYLHLFPPHHPYCPSEKFIGIFPEKSPPQNKPARYFSEGISPAANQRLRQWYDEAIAHTDAEFGRLYDFLLQSGLAKNSYIIVTSDHGELFEREVHGHVTPLLYEPLLHIPLLISTPHQHGRQDIHSLTSTVDILPTLLHLAGKTPAENTDGIEPGMDRILPGLGGQAEAGRSVFAIEAKMNSSFTLLKRGTLVILKDNYKLIQYRGYNEIEDASELYDLRNDPEELEDLALSQKSIAQDLKAELDAELEKSNQTLQK